MKKLLVYWDITESQLEQIKEKADKYDYQLVHTTDLDKAKKEAVDAHILYGCKPEVICHAKEMKWYCTYFAGVNQYVKPGLLPKDCILSNSAGAYGVTIAEHIIMVTLDMMRNFRYNYKLGQTTDWSGKEDVPMDSIYGSRITVLGTGDIGSTFASRVKGFLPKSIVGVNTSGKKVSEDYDRVLTVDRLDEILPETDLLVMSLPGTERTAGIINETRLKLLPNNSYIVNVGRGSAIDEVALVKSLESGKLAGVALDVMGHEPPEADDPIRKAKNLIITPHIAGQMNLSYTKQKAVDMFCEDLDNYCRGKDLKYRVNIELGY